MRHIAAALLLALCAGCAIQPPQGKGTMNPVSAGETIRIAKPVRIIETRGPLAVKLEWQLLPGDYVERYSSPSGRVFVADGPLVQFTPSVGPKQLRYGGYIVLKAQPGVGKLYVAREVPGAIEKFLAGDPTDEQALFQVTDFPLRDLKR
jgi:hypothetical protein